ncbi:MAG TPA: type ISP restriction/modification enzyme [Terriglobales bacterium]|nr:type ISP restriction/modification enzyme [Terriglobales bacterium]
MKGIVIQDNVILSEGAAHQPAPESKNPAFARAGDIASRSSTAQTQGPSTRPSSQRSGGLARDDRLQDDLSVFRALVKAGERLADLHINYEKQPEYPLAKIEKQGEKLDWRVEKMRLSRDKAAITYNQFLTLKCVPPETFAYRLGNRSALEWVIDQYQVSKDKRSGIVNDPNRADDPQYIVRLIGQVITVSLETMKVVKSLPDLGLPAEAQAATAT